MALTKITSTNIGANAVTTSAVNLTAPLAFANSTANVAFFAANGNIGIGTATPGVALDVSGVVKSNSYSQYGSSMYYGIGSSLSGSYGATDLAVYNGANGNTVFLTNNTERMRIDSSGRVTKPNQPAFHASGTYGGGYIGTTSSSPFQFNTTSINVGSAFNTSSYRFTAPVAGVYAFYFSFFFETGQGVSGCDVCYCVNGAQLQSGSGSSVLLTSRPSQDRITLGNTVIISLSVNDYVDVRGRDGTGTGNAIYAPHSCFGGYLLG